MSFAGCLSFKVKATAPKELRDLFAGLKDLIIVGGEVSQKYGALTTVALYKSFAMNPAHLCEDGTIWSYGHLIARVTDIEIEELPS